MFRLVSFMLASLGLAAASPVAAQSLGIIFLPTQPIAAWHVQDIPVQTRDSEASGYVPARKEAITFVAAPEQLPRWQAPDRPAAKAETHRFVETRRAKQDFGTMQYGPFRVVDDRRLELVGETDAMSPSWFAKVLEDYPDLDRLELVECPGTLDDRANLQLGRMIRAAGIATHVPAYGSVRSGAVELFLAGIERSIDDGAEFAVHSWRDEYGREADDFALDAPENRAYLDYYSEMGMSAQHALAFYRMTNSVPHHRARWLAARDMRQWVGRYARMRSPRIAYLSL